MRTKQINILISSLRLLLVMILAGICGCQESLHIQNLTLITDASQRPYLEEAFRNKSQGLLRSIDQSLVWFETSTNTFKYNPPFALLTHQQARQSLVTFRNTLLQSTDAKEFATSIMLQFNIYQSVGNDGRGTVLFTGYFAPQYLASSTQSEQFNYPLYSLPENFYEYRDSQSPTRYEIESSKLLDGYEIAWLEDPLSVYLIQVNGSAKLLLEDGSNLFISYTTTNKHQYTSLGKLLISAGLSKPDEMSMQKIREIYGRSPKLVLEKMLENDRYVFFKESRDSDWPKGSIGVALTPHASLAMDNSVFPQAGIFLVDTSIENARGEPSRYVRLMLNQDTGGAIKGPGRADIYMGVGKQAGDIAGNLKSNGQLFYFLLKRY
ncbi:MAG: MltA domain-containing protein [Planctomycetes bacterium]|nr:MltA domain-containing protein [Planctomycetota bacterium]